MKKLLLTGCMVFVFFGTVLGEPRKKENLIGGFRGTKWGMSKAEVMAIEGAREYVSFAPDSIVYTASDTGTSKSFDLRDGYFFYEFIEDKLFCAGYGIQGNILEMDKAVAVFEKYKENLAKEYGEAGYDSGLLIIGDKRIPAYKRVAIWGGKEKDIVLQLLRKPPGSPIFVTVHFLSEYYKDKE